MSSEDQALERLRRIAERFADQVFVACRLVDGELWLNTEAGLNALRSKNRRWNPEAWVMKQALTDWLPLDGEHEARARSLLLAVDARKASLFPACAEFFKIVYLRNELRLVGRDAIATRLSPDGLAGAAFVEAVESRDLARARACLERIENPDLEVMTGSWEHPLLRVAIKHPALIEVLLEKGASLKDATSWTRDVLILRRLVDEGAPLDVGAEALISAASDGNGVELVKFLLEHGADVNAKDRWGQTALSRARDNGNARVAAFLLAAGAK